MSANLKSKIICHYMYSAGIKHQGLSASPFPLLCSPMRRWGYLASPVSGELHGSQPCKK